MKKVISLILAMTMLLAMFTVSFSAWSVSDEGVITMKEAIDQYEEETGEETEKQRIYFQMPDGKRGIAADEDVLVHVEDLDPETGEVISEHDDVVIKAGEKAPSWYSDYNVVDGKHYAGFYYWDSDINDPASWCGYRAEIADYDQGIYYVDLPIDIVALVWNNGVDGGTDTSKPIYYEAAQTDDMNSQGAEPGMYDSLPYGTPDPWTFDNCIAVVNPNRIQINALSHKQTCGYDWYIYYGNGCYGEEFAEGEEYPDGTDNWSENMQDVCKNPDHFVNGVHVGYHQDTTPTEAPTEAPHVHTPAAAVQENVIPATCVEAGSYDEVVYCSVCHEEISRETKVDPATGVHTEGEPSINVLAKATCQKNGRRILTYNCTVCGQKIRSVTETVPKLDHDLSYVEAVRPTYEAEGTKAHYVCSMCGKFFSDATGTHEVTAADLVIPVLTPTEAPTAAPTEAPTQAPTAAPTEAPTEAPTDAPFVPDPNKLYFDTTTTGWDMTGSSIYFYVFGWHENDTVSKSYKGWNNRRSAGTAVGNGIWEFDPKNLKLIDGLQYKIIFCQAKGGAIVNQTYDLFLDTTCFGDVGYCTGEKIENPADSSKSTLAAFWRGKDPTAYGPVKQITSIGNVVGTCLEQGKTNADLFVDFITIVNETTEKTGLDNARYYVVESGQKTEQELIDDIGTKLGLSKKDVYDAFNDNGVATEWDYKVSALPGNMGDLLGDVNGDGDVTISDATWIQRIDIQMLIPDEAMIIRADVDKDGEVTIADATLIRRYLVGLNQDIGINEPV